MSKSDLSDRRKARVRLAIRKNAGGRPRLSVFRSSKQIYAQVIDDARGVTLASASTLEKSNREGLKTGADKAAAEQIGKLVAQRAVEAGVTEVVFDRGAYMYHGRVKALADGAREGGLKF
ncbi:50S ribosomal protein L18 [Lichenibacterium minor]|uniref:Large ribosomal subunit protein uL18 n=1 Tax=Lichenibacterium minor TaxID=2316528 RepID=A0A4V1RV90_9HYPH|nr:50S ribosomal protein L18 [Lichenibacterium minor]RYC33824.1 50S ribosomal protein L18 [Lichenibacterium minor]